MALVCKVTVSRKRSCKSLNNVLLQSLQYHEATIIFNIYIEGWVRKKKDFSENLLIAVKFPKNY